MVKSAGEPGSSYWYDGEDSAVDLLSALSGFRAADHELRRRLSAGMEMNSTDLSALRYVIAHEVGEDPATPQALARHLGISGASTSKLLDRLTASGHLERVPHPRDGRSRIVVATDHAHAQVRERLGGMHERMLAIAREVPPADRPAIIEFLRAMATHLDTEAPPEELTAPEV
ncbi:MULTISPECIES: MarR family winged helix-turn-helix transcriptional regulator [Brachybacterium]|uniref:MarR family winged helix-turn-helix transcriptional regulator n=1 Tax=Brachybacterium TaxID=43668 RepID=UPI000DF3ABF0|nr:MULTISPECIES: MarR family transcriptional regulator [Brachybacterium]RCS65481.1 MarR family transcriptional regulator [Brachybacterium sp. JB7]RCS77057.1 MarR family transcriptional regulator [Brachybacterium alimentarium]RCS78922.1 MarR family transcriptional regulator [Brachybacterium alimentarium]